jgi:hypothetical protein
LLFLLSRFLNLKNTQFSPSQIQDTPPENKKQAGNQQGSDEWNEFDHFGHGVEGLDGIQHRGSG